jgi:hypothetical protein
MQPARNELFNQRSKYKAVSYLDRNFTERKLTRILEKPATQDRLKQTAASPLANGARFARIGGIIVSSLDVPPLPLM